MKYFIALFSLLAISVAHAFILPIGGFNTPTGFINPLGINLEQPAYYATEFPFINLMKSGGSSPTGYGVGWFTTNQPFFFPGTSEEAYLQTDSDGYVTSLTASPTPPGGQQFTKVLTLLNYGLNGVPPGASSCYQPGTYRLKFIGQGTIQIAGEGSLTLTNSTPSTYVTGTFTVSPACSTSGIILAITAITSGTDYPRDISVVYQPYAAAYDAGAIFSPVFLAQLAPFSSLRFMQWKRINDEYFGSTATASVSSGATSLTLSSAWGEPSGAYPVTFIDGETRSATFTLGATTMTWTGGLSNTISNAACTGFGNWQWGSLCYGNTFYVGNHTWANRSKPSNAFWDNIDGVPLEIAVALCNQTHVASCYLNVPLAYSDADIQAMGQLVMSGTGMQSGFTGLSSTQTAAFELSNETWNCGAFSQCPVEASLGAITWPGQPSGGGNISWQLNYHGMRTAQMATDLQTAVGGTIFGRVYPTLGSQVVTSSATTMLASSYWTSGPASSYPIKQLAIAPYWGGNPSAADCTTMTGVTTPLDDFFATLSSQTGTAGNGSHTYSSIPTGGWETQSNNWVSSFASLMTSYPSIHLVGYEGGDSFYACYNTGICIPTNTCSGWPALITAAERDPRMGAAYVTQQNFWKTNVGSTQLNVFNVFQDVGPISSVGSFGLLENTLQTISPLSAAPPKYNGAVTYIQ